MCMLTVFPMPDLMNKQGIERLLNGANLNPHGSGWAVINNGRILTGKAMAGEEAVESFLDAYDTATGPALFHSRWATHGSKRLANVHPFPVYEIGGMYVAHNGVMPSDAWPDQDDDRSDTRVFADDILPRRYRRLDSAKVRNHLDDWLGGNKIAILTTNRRYRRNLYLFGVELGTWVDGVWYSNHDYDGAQYKYILGGKGAGYAYDGHSFEECDFCHSWGRINVYGYCEECGTCCDCDQGIRDCLCYAGSSGTAQEIIQGSVSVGDTVIPDEDPDAEPSLYSDIPSEVLRQIADHRTGFDASELSAYDR